MSTAGTTEVAASPTFGILAEFANPRELYHACTRVRDAGFTRWDAHSPFPVHGLDAAMGLKPSMLPWISFVLGISGAVLAMAFQGWTSTVDYALIISNKPLFSWQAYVPITFEVGVLCGAAGAVLGILVLGRLGFFHNPLFNSRRFERVTDDAFFISIEATDPKFNEEQSAEMLRALGATHVEVIRG